MSRALRDEDGRIHATPGEKVWSPLCRRPCTKWIPLPEAEVTCVNCRLMLDTVKVEKPPEAA